MTRNLLFVLITLFVSEGYSQGKIDGFYNGKGAGSAVLGIGFEDSKKYIAGSDKIDLGRSVYYASLFGTYGITDGLDVNISMPYIISDDNRNLQDVSVLLKYRIIELGDNSGKLEMSIALGVSTPVSNYELGGLNDIGQQATVIDSRAMIHYKLNDGWFATLQSGFSFKLAETPNSLPITFKAGQALSKWYYDVYYDYQHSFGGIDYLGTPRPQNFKKFGVDFHKMGGTIFTSFSENLGAYLSLSYIFEGRNVFTGPAYGFGLVYGFRSN